MADEDKILHEDVLQVLQESGIDALRNPGLFSSFMLDADAGRTKSARILLRNCSPKLLDPFANAGRDAMAINQARQRAHAYLTTDCGLGDEVARRIADALESGLCSYYGISSVREQREQEQRERQLELLPREREERLHHEAELKHKQASAANQTAAGQASQDATENAARYATQNGRASDDSNSFFWVAALVMVALVGSSLVSGWHYVESGEIGSFVEFMIITLVFGCFMSGGTAIMIKEIITNHEGSRLRVVASMLAGIAFVVYTFAPYMNYGDFSFAVEHGFGQKLAIYVTGALWIVLLGSNLGYRVLNSLHDARVQRIRKR